MKKKVFLNITIVVFISVLLFSGYKLYTSIKVYRDVQAVEQSFAEYKPELPTKETEETKAQSTVNSGVIKAQEINSDIIGWLTVSNTQIDYPFVYSTDNKDYLRKDLYGNYSVAGTVFADYRCNKDLSCFNTIIYGHRMNDGSMFGGISKYADADYFNNHKTGYIFFPYKTYSLNIFAYLVVDMLNEVIYSPNVDLQYSDCEAALLYIKENALQYDDIGVLPTDKIVTLSTCNQQFNGARAVIVAKLSPLQ